MIVSTLGWYLTMTLIGAIIGLPLMLSGFIMMLVGIFTPSQVPKIIIEAHHQQATNTQKMQTTDAQIQCTRCHNWNPINATHCKSCGKKL